MSKFPTQNFPVVKFKVIEYWRSLGDISSIFKQLADFTFDGTWNTMDFSSLFPDKVGKVVQVKFTTVIKGTSGGLTVCWRKRGYVNEINIACSSTNLANTEHREHITFEVDNDGIAEYKGDNSPNFTLYDLLQREVKIRL